MASTVTMCSTIFEILNPESTKIFVVDASSTAAEQLIAFPT